MPLFCVFGSLSLGLTNCVLNVLVPLKCTFMPLDLHSLLNFSLVPFDVGNHQGYVPVYNVVDKVVFLIGAAVVPVLLLGWLLLRNFWCHWLSAHFGNWHACSAVLVCSSSMFSNSCVEDTIFALCANLLYILCFGCYVMIAVPMKVMICMGWFSVDCCAKSVV